MGRLSRSGVGQSQANRIAVGDELDIESVYEKYLPDGGAAKYQVDCFGNQVLPLHGKKINWRR